MGLAAAFVPLPRAHERPHARRLPRARRRPHRSDDNRLARGDRPRTQRRLQKIGRGASARHQRPARGLHRRFFLLRPTRSFAQASAQILSPAPVRAHAIETGSARRHPPRDSLRAAEWRANIHGARHDHDRHLSPRPASGAAGNGDSLRPARRPAHPAGRTRLHLGTWGFNSPSWR